MALSKTEKRSFSQRNRSVSLVVHNAINAEGLGFDSQADQIGHSAPTARHHYDVFDGAVYSV